MVVDQKIISGCIAGERPSQFALYELCYSALKNVCLRYVHQDEEVRALLNMGFFKILSNLDRYDSHIPFEAWGRRIMINHIIDEYRKNKRERELTIYTDNAGADYISMVDLNHADLDYEAEELLAMIRKLPQPYNKAFNLFAIDGYSHKEIAEILDCNENSSKWYVNQARKKLKEMLEASKDGTYYSGKIKEM